jgi:hypothetical protein
MRRKSGKEPKEPQQGHGEVAKELSTQAKAKALRIS